MEFSIPENIIPTNLTKIKLTKVYFKLIELILIFRRGNKLGNLTPPKINDQYIALNLLGQEASTKIGKTVALGKQFKTVGRAGFEPA